MKRMSKGMDNEYRIFFYDVALKLHIFCKFFYIFQLGTDKHFTLIKKGIAIC